MCSLHSRSIDTGFVLYPCLNEMTTFVTEVLGLIELI